MPISISSPAVNLRSPTAIGDVTPNTVAGTVVTTNALKAVQGGGADLVITSGLGVDKINVQNGGFDVLFIGGIMLGNGNTAAIFTPGFAQDIPVNNGAQTLYADGKMKAKLQTSTNATTGLGAGLLAATTNATVVIYDGSGQAYRVPCII